MTKFLNDERVPREDGGATLHIMFHSFVILLKYEALNEDVLQDGVFSNISGLKQFLVRMWGIKLTKLLTSIPQTNPKKEPILKHSKNSN